MVIDKNKLICIKKKKWSVLTFTVASFNHSDIFLPKFPCLLKVGFNMKTK